jgi:hypothetical protein
MNMLCQPCADIFSGQWHPDPTSAHRPKQAERPSVEWVLQHDSFESFKQCSCDRQCKLCLALWDRLCHRKGWDRADRSVESPTPNFRIRCSLQWGVNTAYYEQDGKEFPCVQMEFSYHGENENAWYLAELELWPEGGRSNILTLVDHCL